MTQTARGSSASECLSSSPYVLSLSSLLTSCLPSFLNTRQQVTAKIGQHEAVKLNLEDSMVCVEDPMEGRAKNKNLWKDHSMTWKKKQANWQIVTAALVINEEHMSDCNTTLKLCVLCPTKLGRRTSPTILQERICQITVARWMHPCNVLEWKQIH